MKSVSWDKVLTCGAGLLLVILGWVFIGGQLSGKTTQRMEAIEIRQDALERMLQNQLVMLSDGLVEVSRKLDVLTAEQRILHRGELRKLER